LLLPQLLLTRPDVVIQICHFLVHPLFKLPSCVLFDLDAMKLIHDFIESKVLLLDNVTDWLLRQVDLDQLHVRVLDSLHTLWQDAHLVVNLIEVEEASLDFVQPFILVSLATHHIVFTTCV